MRYLLFDQVQNNKYKWSGPQEMLSCFSFPSENVHYSKKEETVFLEGGNP